MITQIRKRNGSVEKFRQEKITWAIFKAATAVGGNDMTGQFCIHFVDSKTHGSNKVDADHQSCIDEAYRAGQ